MEIVYSGRQITINDTYTTLLDRFVFEFVNTISGITPYVIVSGYVAILFGRSRGTEDVDVLIPPVERIHSEPFTGALPNGGMNS